MEYELYTIGITTQFLRLDRFVLYYKIYKHYNKIY